MKNVLAVALAMALIPAYAYAVDGQVLINQSTVNAAGGFPYTITQPGSYKLSGNLVVPLGVNGFEINADGVTIDLNGFSITGSGLFSPLSIAFHGTNRQRILIMNGTMSGLGGIQFLGASQYITIERINHDGTVFMTSGSPVRVVGVVLGQDVASHSIMRGVQSTGFVLLTCPGSVIDTTAGLGVAEIHLPANGLVDPIGTNCKAVNVY